MQPIAIDHDKWVVRKREFWKRMWEDLEIGYLDEDLLPLLIEFNLRPHVYTLSSCSGRIVLADSTKPWAREESSVVFKKHSPVSFDEVLAVYRKPVVRRLWIISSGPIIHVSTYTLEEALKILKIAREAGFKHSGILSINKFKGIVLELVTGIRFMHLLKARDRVYTHEEDLEGIVEIANEILLDGKTSLEQLYNILRRSRPYVLDEYVVSDLIQRGILV